MSKLSEKQIELISQFAVQAALSHLEKQNKKIEQTKHDRRLHNIRLLLSNYRGLVLHCEDIVEDLSTFQSMSIQDLDISTISLESIESIKKSKEKSLTMVWYIRSKMDAYKNSCTQDDLRYFRVLEKKYLTPVKWSIKQIAESESIDKATVYRYLDKVIADLPVVFFGVDAIHFE